MREKTTNGQVIIVYTEHPVFGILLIPYIAERLEDGTLQLIEQAFHASPEAIEQMNEAERQYKQYVKIFARTYGTTIEEAAETRMCKEYKKYCEEVFSVGIPDEISNE